MAMTTQHCSSVVMRSETQTQICTCIGGGLHNFCAICSSAVVHLASLHICKPVHGCACGFLMTVSNTIVLQGLLCVQGLLTAQRLEGLGFVQACPPARGIGGVAQVSGGFALEGQAAAAAPLQK